MVRPRVYENNAQRQAQYRARQANGQQELFVRLERLQDSLKHAANFGDPLANTCRADDRCSMLDDLIAYFERRSGFSSH